MNDPRAAHGPTMPRAEATAPARFAQRAAAFLLALCLPAGAASAARGGPEESAPPAFPLRIVDLRGDPRDEDVRLHLDYCAGLGFNAVWVDAAWAGRWNGEAARGEPAVDPRFAEWATTAARRGLRVFLVIQPLRDSSGAYVFTRPENVRRIRDFAREARRSAGVRDFVLSFENASLTLEELQDVLRFGAVSAPAHLEMARALRQELSRKDRLWFAPTIASTAGLQEPGIAYSAALLSGLPGLDKRVGLVWNGPDPVSAAITADDLAALRSIAGERPVVLQDRYPAGLGPQRLTLALALAPLRGRDPKLRLQLDGYLSVPMAELGGSRLALRTVADFLRQPERYDADESWRAATAVLAGKDPSALDALRTQAMEWGGWVTERNYRSPLRENPIRAAEDLRDPAAVALWGWVERRYPLRMWELGRLEDGVFRSDLLRVMGRRLVVARAMPLVRDLHDAFAAGSPEARVLLGRLRAQRAQAAAELSALTALDRFLAAAGIAPLVLEPREAAP